MVRCGIELTTALDSHLARVHADIGDWSTLTQYVLSHHTSNVVKKAILAWQCADNMSHVYKFNSK
jgi:hypothetical protein